MEANKKRKLTMNFYKYNSMTNNNIIEHKKSEVFTKPLLVLLYMLQHKLIIR